MAAESSTEVETEVSPIAEKAKKRGFFSRFFLRKPGSLEETEKRDYNHICKVRDKERKDFYLTQAQLAILHHHAEEFSATPSLSLSGGVALKSNGAIVFGSLKELPQDVYASVGRMKVPEKELEEHLDIMANILSFADKVRPRRKFLTKAQHAVQSDSSFDREGFNNRHLPRMYVAPDELFKQIKVREVKKMFKICDYLGDGGYGNVVGAKVLGKQYPPKVKFVAIKYQDVGTSQSAKTLVAHEASFLKWADHPSICKFYDSIQVQSEVWIVTEMLEGGTLKEAAAASSQWSESSIAYVAAKMLAGISYLHENQLAHRDLKNLNVMFTVQAEVKLIDFGLCVDLCNGPTVAMIGSPFWMAPEMICGVPHSFPVDIWSFMVCMLELANRRPPDCKNVRRALFKHAVHGMGPDSALEKPDQWTDTFKAFLASGFHMNPAERSTAADLLKHPFLEKINSRENMCKMLSGIFLDKSVVAGGIL